MGFFLENGSDYCLLERGIRYLFKIVEGNKEWCKFFFFRWDEGIFIDVRGLDFRIRELGF